jgi:hypothetical protein
MIDTQAGCSWGHRHAPPAGGHHNGDGGELRHGHACMGRPCAHALCMAGDRWRAWRRIAGGQAGETAGGLRGYETGYLATETGYLAVIETGYLAN